MNDHRTPPTPCRQYQTVHMGGRELSIEYQYIPGPDAGSDLLVFLHEGLGSVGMWKDWPRRLCEAMQCRGLVFSRYGYGASTQRADGEKWPVEFMHSQAHEALPTLLASLGFENERPILYGHSDGGSIALLYAAMHPDRIKAIIVAAPHIFVEDITIANIEQARTAYQTTDLPHKLARYHQNPDSAFWGWNDMWLNPEFRHWNIEPYLPEITCPVLAIQGTEDEYGTLEQIYGIQQKAAQTRLCILDRCGHHAHKDQPQAVIAAILEFTEDFSISQPKPQKTLHGADI
uniref:alpha/beta fold hydrolase n=1 Tax=Castellaniella defragrans TaxID=75697 RepID=UPI00334077C8